MNRSPRSRRGFTLIEILVAIAILGVLMGLLLPAIQRVREVATRTTCQNKMRQIGVAIHQHHNDHGRMPPAYTWVEPSGGSQVYKANKSWWDFLKQPPAWDRLPADFFIDPCDPGWGWAVYLMPYLELDSLYKQLDRTQPTTHAANLDLRNIPLAAYTCPADSGTGRYEVFSMSEALVVDAATNSYAAVYGAEGLLTALPDQGTGAMYRNSKTRFADVTDGTSATFAIGERGAFFARAPWIGAITNGVVKTTPNAPVYWASVQTAPAMPMCRVGRKPLNDPWSEPYDFFSPHSNVAIFLFVDGSVHAIPFAANNDVLQALATRGGAESSYDW